LTRAITGLQVLRRQSLAVAAVLLGGIVDLIEHVNWAAPLAISAGLVLLCLAIKTARLASSKRELARDLIVEGRQSLPIAAVQRERQRLGRSRTRQQLARTVEAMIGQARHPPTLLTPCARPLFDISVITSVAEDLHAISRLLRSEPAPVPGVARLERLLTDGMSPLYGHQASPLREELDRIRQAMTPSVGLG
jgi:hypothetical protein